MDMPCKIGARMKLPAETQFLRGHNSAPYARDSDAVAYIDLTGHRNQEKTYA